MKEKEPPNTKVAVIGGTGLESLLQDAEQVRVGTPYGLPPSVTVGDVQGWSVAFLPRHSFGHSVPPHKVNYKASVFALRKIGVERVIATNAVGAVNLDFKPGDLVIPHDLIDFTKQRSLTFCDDAPVTHIDFTEPYCPEIRGVLIDRAKRTGHVIWDRAVYACTEGPRFETPAEIRMLRVLGCDVVGMTGVPEAVLARELGMCYATLCFVTNMAAGIGGRFTSQEVMETSRMIGSEIHKILLDVIPYLPKPRRCSCSLSTEESGTGEGRRC